MTVDLDDFECPICGSPNITISIQKSPETYKIVAVYCTDQPHVWRCEID
jgi:transcription elongation factor Elf1